MSATRQCRLEREVPPLGDVLADLSQEQPARRHLTLLGRQRRPPGGNQVGVDEDAAIAASTAARKLPHPQTTACR